MSNIEENNKKSNVSETFKSTLKQFYISFGKWAVIFIGIVVALAAVTYFIFVDEGLWEDEETGRPSTYTGSVQMSPTDGIVVDGDAIIDDTLSNEGLTEEQISNLTDEEIIDILDMEEKLDREITSLDECTNAEILWCSSDEYARYLDKPEELEFLLTAELVTQYPKIDGVPEEKNGKIEFKRTILDRDDLTTEKEVMLKYISNEEFDEKFQDYYDNGNKEIFEYFTLDEEQNAIIATWSIETGKFESDNTVHQDRNKINPGYDIDKIKNDIDERYELKVDEENLIKATYTTERLARTPINYKSMVQQYVLQFEYLWALLVMGESYDFVEGLAQLAYDTEIHIGIYDSITTDQEVNRKEYTENFRERRDIYENNRLYEEIPWTDPPEFYPYYEQETVIFKYNTPGLDVAYADTWIVEEKTTYAKVRKESDNEPNSSTPGDEDWSDNGSKVVEWDDRRTRPVPKLDADGNPMYDPATGEPIMDEEFYHVHVREEIYKEKRLTNQKNVTDESMIYDIYEEVSTEVIEKTDPEADTNNFPKLLKNDEKAYSLLTNKGVVAWLVEVLEAKESTANLVDLTLYLLNKTTGTEDYIDEDKINFDDLWTDVVISVTPVTIAGEDYIVDTSQSSSEIVITDREVLINAIKSVYSGEARDNLISQVDTFLELQKEPYNVNAVFAIAVTQAESSCGTNFSGAIPRWTHNWMSMTGSYNGQTYRNPNSANERTWRVYPSFREATLDFGNIIANGSYYFKAGRYTVSQIAPTYCNAAWGEKVIAYMTKIYSAAGISTLGLSGDLTITGGIGGTESNTTGTGDYEYRSTFTVGERVYKNYKQPSGSDWCGITSAAIALSGYGFNTITPQTIYDRYGYNWRAGLHQILNIPFNDYVTTDLRVGIITQLKEGKPVIVHVPPNSGKYNTDYGHFFVLLSINEEGTEFYVSDPGGYYYNRGRNGWNRIDVVLQYVDKYIKL